MFVVFHFCLDTNVYKNPDSYDFKGYILDKTMLIWVNNAWINSVKFSYTLDNHKNSLTGKSENCRNNEWRAYSTGYLFQFFNDIVANLLLRVNYRYEVSFSPITGPNNIKKYENSVGIYPNLATNLITISGLNPVNLDAPVGKMIDCAYSIAPIEYLDIPNAKVGEYYLVMINNYANCSGMYSFNKTSGYGCTDCGIVLPVEMVSFETNCNKDQVEITWATASETNSSHFIIEKSLDAKNFVAVANVKAAGNSNQAINYSYTDKEGGSSAYYRIKQFDYDGKYAIYDAKHTMCESLENVELYPNPAKTAVTIDHFKGEYLVLNFINILGQTVFTMEIKSENLKDIDISSLENGYYVVKLMDENGNIKVFHLIKQD